MKKKLSWTITGVLLLCVILLRLWDVPKYFVFDIDVQYQALLGWEQVKNFHVIWIGVSASNLGYYLGPGLVYLTGFLLRLSNGDPIILGYFASFVGILTAASFYYVTKRVFDQKTALIALTLYGFSHFMIYYDRSYWPIFIPLVSIWIFFSLIESKRNIHWLILSIILVSAAYHIHLSLLLFWPPILYSMYTNRKRLTPLFIAVLAGLYLIITAPLLVFDILHNFDNLLLPLRLLESPTNNGGIDIIRSLDYLKTVVSKIFIFSPASMTTPLVILSGVILTLFLRTKNWGIIKQVEKYLIGILILQLLAILIYPGPLQLYYGVLLAPFVILTVSIGIQRIRQKYQVALLLIYAILNVFSFFGTSQVNGVSTKKEFIESVAQQVGDRTYRLEFDGERDYAGWRYLFQAYMGTPTSSTADQMFGWIYSSTISESQNVIVYVGENPTDENFTKITSGPYTAYIIE